MATSITYSTLLEDLRRYTERAFSLASDPLVYDQLPRIINMAERAITTELKIQGAIENVTSALTAGNDVYAKPGRWRETISLNFGTAKLFSTLSRVSVVGTKTLTLERPHGYKVGAAVIVSGVGDASYNGAHVLTAVTQLGISYVNGVANEALTADTGGLVSLAEEKRTFLLPRSYEYCRTYWPDPRVVGLPLYYADYQSEFILVVPTPVRSYPYEWNYYQLPQLLDVGNQSNWLTELAPNLLLYRCLLELAPFLKNDERQQVWQGQYDRYFAALSGEDIDKIMDRAAQRKRS